MGYLLNCMVEYEFEVVKFYDKCDVYVVMSNCVEEMMCFYFDIKVIVEVLFYMKKVFE